MKYYTREEGCFYSTWLYAETFDGGVEKAIAWDESVHENDKINRGM
jgi:hypothetical protein